MRRRQRVSFTGGLEGLDDSPWKTRISEPRQNGFSRWRGDEAARRAVTNNRARLKSGVAREACKLRAEIVERSFAHNLDRRGMRRTWLRGRENVHMRYLLHVTGHNLSLLRRQLIGAGTPRGGRGRRIWLYLRAHDAHWRRSGRSDTHRLGGWRNRLRRVMFRRGVKSSHRRPFQQAGNYGCNSTSLIESVGLGHFAFYRRE